MSTDTLSYTIPHAARLSGFPLSVLTAAVACGNLRAKKATPTARYRRILRSDLDAWLQALPDA